MSDLPTATVTVSAVDRLLQMFDEPDAPETVIDPKVRRAQIRNSILLSAVVLTGVAITPATAAVGDTLQASQAKAVSVQKTSEVRLAVHVGAEKKVSSAFNSSFDGLPDALTVAVRGPALAEFVEARGVLTEAVDGRSLRGLVTARHALESKVDAISMNAADRALLAAEHLTLADQSSRDVLNASAGVLQAATGPDVPAALKQVADAQTAAVASQAAAVTGARDAARAATAAATKAEARAAARLVATEKANADSDLAEAVQAAVAAAQVAADERAAAAAAELLLTAPPAAG